MTVGTRIQKRRDPAATWTSNNPVLLAGEEGWESDTGKYKTGDGTTAWNALSYPPYLLSTVATATFAALPAAADKIVHVSSRGNDSSDGTTPKSALLTVAAAVTKLGGPGTIRLGQGNMTLASLDVSSTLGITIEGPGGKSAGSTPAAALVFTTTGSGSALNAQNSIAFTLKNVMVLYTSTSFTGRLIDLRNVSGSDTIFARIEDCYIGGSGSATADALIDMAKSYGHRLVGNVFGAAVHAVRGRGVSGDYANGVTFTNCYFANATTAHIHNPGDGWAIEGCIWEPLASGAAGAILTDSAISIRGLSILGGWCGDVTSGAGGSQFDLQGSSIAIIGTFIGGNVGSTGVKFHGTCNGLTVAASFNGCATGIDSTSVFPTNYDFSRSTFAGVTTERTPNTSTVSIDSDGSYPALYVHGSGASYGGGGVIRYTADRTSTKQFDQGIDTDGGNRKEFQLWNPITGDIVQRFTQGGSAIIGKPSPATTATDGFAYIPAVAGTPTGAPTAQTGFAPIVLDTSGNKIWVYNGSAWKSAALT